VSAKAEPLAAGVALGQPRKPLPGARDRVGQVGREKPGIAQAIPDRIAGHAVEVDAELRCVERRQPLGEKRSDRARQDVARPAACHGRIFEGRHGHGAVRRGDDSAGPLQDHDLVPRRRGAPRCRGAGGVVVGQIAVRGGIIAAAGAKASEFTRVRRQDGRPVHCVPPAIHRGQRAKGLSIKHDRGRCRLCRYGDELANQLNGRQARSETRSEDHSVVLVIEDPGERRIRLDLLHVVFGKSHRGGLDDLGREERLEGLGHGQRHEAGTGAARRTADQERRAGVIEGPSDDEELAEAALVAALGPLRQELGDLIVVELDRPLRLDAGRRVAFRGFGRLTMAAESDRPTLRHRRHPPEGWRQDPLRWPHRRARAGARAG